jgi:GNAT superfamily N-acetyltransferase
MGKTEIRRLTPADAHDLAPLLAAYAQDRKRGAPRVPDDFYAERLLGVTALETLGICEGERLLGFAMLAELPDMMTGLKLGELTDIFVLQDARGRGLGRALVASVIEAGRRHGWSEVRWLVPDRPQNARAFAERLAKPGRWSVFALDLQGDPLG